MQETDNLIELAQNGNPDAAGLLYHHHHPAIFRYLFYRTGERQTAEDLTGEVFLKMVQAIGAFNGGPGAFRAWLFQIARNLSIDHLRKIQAHPSQAIGDELRASGLDPEHSTEKNLTEAALCTALTQLPDDQKDVILMRFVNGLPLAETARALHKSEDAVKGLQRRGLAALRESLAPME
jgi:RNA polymerase sigma-70 factor (ECF subfamily)